MLRLARQPLSSALPSGFASTSTRKISTAHIPSIRINGARLNASLHETCDAFGSAPSALRYGPGPTETGMCRLALSDSDAGVRHWFASAASKAGCSVTVDEMGNMFAIRPGKKAGAPVAIGSHLDTQPTGGRYDGILGIHAGLEILRTLEEGGVETEYPIVVVNWTNEEGARFPKSVVSSSVWAGIIPLETAWALADVRDPTATMKSELERIGFLGATKCSAEAMPLAAHFELHIEQGPILEATNKRVGAVLGAQAYRWYTLQVKGRDSHTGTTPFSTRSDALLCAAKIIVASNTLAKQFNGVATTGILTLSPGSTNVIPSHVALTLDLRHSSDTTLAVLDAALQAEAERIASDESERGCKLEWRMDTDAPAAVFHADAVRAVKEAATSVVGEDGWAEIWSGAGHDSCAASTRCPTAMIFVPSKDGISHNPVEYTSPEECATGTQVVLEAVLRYDARRTE